MRVLLLLLLPFLAVAQPLTLRDTAFVASLTRPAAAGGGGPLVFDATSTTNKNTAVSSLTIQITNSSAADRSMGIMVAYDANASGASATVDSNAATELFDLYHPDFGNLFAIAGYSFVNQAAGVNVIVVSFAGGNPDTSAIGVVCFSNADTNSPTRTAATAFASTGTTSSVTAPSATTGDIVLDAVYAAVTTGITVGANQTSRVEIDGLGGGAFSFGVSTQDGVDGGVMTWTFLSGIWNAGTAAFKAKP